MSERISMAIALIIVVPLLAVMLMALLAWEEIFGPGKREYLGEPNGPY